MVRLALAASGLLVLALAGCGPQPGASSFTRSEMNCQPSDPEDPSAYLGCVRGEQAQQAAPAPARR
jgi:hypothetical protein